MTMKPMCTTEDFNTSTWAWAKKMMDQHRIMAHKDWYMTGHIMKLGKFYSGVIPALGWFCFTESEADARFGSSTAEWLIHFHENRSPDPHP